MGKHELDGRRNLLPVLGFVVLIIALVVVGRAAGAGIGDGDDVPEAPAASGSTEADPEPEESASPSAEPTPRILPGGRGERRANRELAERVMRRLERVEREPAAATFRMSTFNVLGDSHTAAHGNRPGMASGVTRMGWTVQLMRSTGVSVVGFQEYEIPQHAAFQRMMPGWGVYPGLQEGRPPIRNSIVWDTAVWELAEARVTPIRYFGGEIIPMPYILLEHRDTGRLSWFFNIHNPASTRGRGNNQHWRTVSTNLEIDLMNRLQATGIPTFLMGDFNEKAEAFCAITQRADAQAANGGSQGDEPCALPPGHGIDWIFGSRQGVTFSNYVRLQNELVRRTSDHPMILADVTLDGPVESPN